MMRFVRRQQQQTPLARPAMEESSKTKNNKNDKSSNNSSNKSFGRKRGRKSTSLFGKQQQQHQERRGWAVVRSGGVFVSRRTLATAASSSVHRTAAAPCSLASIETSLSFRLQEQQQQQQQQQAIAAATRAWKTSGARNHNKNAPLVVGNPDNLPVDEEKDVADRQHDKRPSSSAPTEEEAQLEQVRLRCKDLPRPFYYMSNHVLVNEERARRTLMPLIRMRELDAIARVHAEQMALQAKLYHINLDHLCEALQHKTVGRLGENIMSGESVFDIHVEMMMSRSERNNIVDPRFTHMGMGTARGHDGRLYLCQLFRG